MIRRKLPALVWSALFLTWVSAFVALACLVQSKAGMGDGIVEGDKREKALAAWARDGQVAPRQPAVTKRARQ